MVSPRRQRHLADYSAAHIILPKSCGSREQGTLEVSGAFPFNMFVWLT
jgi:vacuolar-type H+-ATPase catalytic subunit A/Vma1